MIRDRVADYGERIWAELRSAFQGDHTPHEVAASFAIGIFITALPTGGVGVGLFFVFVSMWSWVNKAAIFSTVVVLNPFVKPGVYLASYHVGSLVVGTEPIFLLDVPAIDYVLEVVQLVLFGNLLVALVLSLVGYLLVYELTRTYRRRNVDLFGSTSEP